MRTYYNDAGEEVTGAAGSRGERGSGARGFLDVAVPEACGPSSMPKHVCAAEMVDEDVVPAEADGAAAQATPAPADASTGDAARPKSAAQDAKSPPPKRSKPGGGQQRNIMSFFGAKQ